ncbi:hypothetical protein [Microbacterium galbinum]|uniref:Uncharacterized protein n=1 Tax=Microbacterium galbinum TaxID=2851646 RepID=A0ABY4IP96_9MICO|nr:hypothetical protein [Microbacterium galbinum]MCK2030935.1 hypothetical protein [Microbacterium galbinum]UPL13388.1 hypothetical protein KV396_02400 [Microbacterium galbinum]
MNDSHNTQGTPGTNDDAGAASGGASENGASEQTGASEETEKMLRDESTDDDGMPLENPSGG